MGPGNLVLTASSTLSGPVTISAGTLQIGIGGAGGRELGGGSVTDNGSLVFYHSDATTLSAKIGGSGSMTQAGTGILILAASNTYTGPTFVLGGTLQVGNGGGGEYLASPSVILSSGPSLVFNHLDALTYSGQISGGGGLARRARAC